MSMELKSSSPKSGGVALPDCDSDPEEKEMSDDDDDDRNHKHRRRETRSQSLERGPLEQALTQPYRKRNRPFLNGQSDTESQFNLDRNFSKFERRHPVGVNFSRFSGERGSGRGRGRDYHRDSRFGSVDISSQMAHPGPISSAMFSGRGLSNVSNTQSASWSGFGLIPGVPNGAMDAMNPLGLPGILTPQLNPLFNMGIQRQICRDFEERGFCLRGDMCPMEHGVNRIVVEDVQSLSQFNLPVSLSSAHLLGTSPANGFVPPGSGSSTALIHNSRGLHSRTNEPAVEDASGPDVYDPDQPLWNNNNNNNNGHEISTPLGLQPPSFHESESLMDADLSDRLVRSSGTASGSQSTSSSVWGRLCGSKNKLELKENVESRTKPSEYPEGRPKEIHDALGGTQGTSHIGKQNDGLLKGSTSKVQNDRKPSQKAHRTLFVNCIPLKDNKKENLLSHFRKFGEVIDIYIPANSERAFVQFSKREEAERALKAPDAVMGSRFIKLWWANRDSIVDQGITSGNNVSMPPREVPVVVNKGKDNLENASFKLAVPKNLDGIVTCGSETKSVVANSPKPLPQVQKKMENLEILKEELRKKQEMLEKKRNEFRQQLDKLAKHATPAGQAAKKPQVETSFDAAKSGNATSADADISGSSLQTELLVDKMVNKETLVDKMVNKETMPSQRAKTNPAASLKQTVRPMATSETPFHMNRYKLDNRPTTFRINAPLPAGLANVTALRDHFSLYGEISNVEIDELGEEDSPNASKDSKELRNCSARVSFATRHSAERAFVNGKSWNEHNLQFIWVASNVPSSSRSSGESSSALKGVLNAEVQSTEKTTHNNSQDIKESNSFPHKSASYIPLEGDEPEKRDFEVQEEEESASDDNAVG